MRKLYLSIAVIAFFIATVLAFRYRGSFNPLREWLPERVTEGMVETDRKGHLEWRRVDQSAQGFKLEMPGTPQRLTLQADNLAGSTDPVNMLQVKPDADRTYSIAWADRPPVAQANELVADKTLDQARDGALSRTLTTKISEIRSNPQGFPGRDLEARNSGGGILDARLIYAGSRLYMLIATSPSEAARREDDISRFFNSFAISANSQIPDTLQPATSQ